jgi:tetratricopeptide (TPR) repeat protein
MRFVRHIQLILVALLLPVNVYAQVQECDRLAASPFDPQKQTTGLSFDKINPNLAIPACKKATEDNPQVARLWFQYGRALEKANRLPDAIYAYQAAAKLNSGAAYNNIGELYRDGKGFQKDLNKAAEYFTLAANLNSPEGKSNLSALQSQQKKVGSQQNVEALIDKCFDRKVAEERQRGGSVFGTMIPALLGECKTEIDAASIGTSSESNAAAAPSPSFDCGKATTPVEKLICNSPELSKLDVSLAETYKEAVSKDRSVRDDQRSWNGEKNKCSDVECLKTAYEDRISQLVNLIVRHDRAALRQDQAQPPPQRAISLAERTAIQLGPETNAMCLLLSWRQIGLSLAPEATNFRNGLIRYAEVFVGVSKFQNESQFTAYVNGNKERVKQASFQDISDYFANNCMKPEVKQLVNSGWK